LLPIRPADDPSLKHHWDYIYEPDAKLVMTALLTRYLESLVYQGVVENIACEQAARMVAMKAPPTTPAT
jgi:F-type H+-transporting ATPase subunit gamma